MLVAEQERSPDGPAAKAHRLEPEPQTQHVNDDEPLVGSPVRRVGDLGVLQEVAWYELACIHVHQWITADRHASGRWGACRQSAAPSCSSGGTFPVR